MICVCWNASWKNTCIFCWYKAAVAGEVIQPLTSPESAVGSATTAATSASVGASPRRMFLTFATYTEGGSAWKAGLGGVVELLWQPSKVAAPSAKRIVVCRSKGTSGSAPS